MIALVVIVAVILGWHTARYHRARKDLAGAKSGVKIAKKIVGVERVPFLIAATIAVLIIWWWLNRHGG